jgi:CDP-glucose 4,6-dehydratase
MGLRQGALEGLVNPNSSFWHRRPVLLTGHTGFKGGWLALWLKELGAEVHGYSIEPPTTPNLFEAADIAALLASDTRADLADLARLKATLHDTKPHIVLHLAAQPLVREGYREPLKTFAANVMGTANVLEAIRDCPTVRAAVLVTTDKVYENRAWNYPYRECDPLGGHDPYSASKAAAEIVASAYRHSFFAQAGHAAKIATVRAGNVVGGGDWALDRLVPDCLRAFSKGEAVQLRYPGAVRPWQHVLEPLSGYLLLAQSLLGDAATKFADAWNFGPDASGDATVGDVAALAAGLWGEGAEVVRAPSQDNPPEAGLLRLDSSRARIELGWRPRWSLRQMLEQTIAWHRAWLDGKNMAELSREQLRAYQILARS